jgi:hypothetical protein
MTLQVFGSAAALIGASALVGYALSLLGVGGRLAAPAVGLALLIVIAGIAIRLPGGVVTAAAGVLIAVLAAAAVVAAKSPRRPLAVSSLWRLPTVPVLTAIAAAAGAAIPFVANGRVGLLGVSLDNDTSAHLIYAEALRSPAVRRLYGLPSGYPLGPHSIVDVLSSGLGVRLDLAFTGLMLATVVITALVAAAALRDEAGWKRVVTGVLASLLYLVAAYYAEGAFKELLLGLLLLALVLEMETARRIWALGPRVPSRSLVLVSMALLSAGAIYVYSYLALAWFGLTLAIWIAAEVALHPRLARRWRALLGELRRPLLAAGALFAILVVPTAARLTSFASTIGTSPAGTGAIPAKALGNLAHALSPYEALGIWSSIDFRLVPTNSFHAGELAVLALAVLLFGLAWSLSRRELPLPAAVAACAIIFWRANDTQSPYVAAKALVIAGPVIAVTGLRGLLGTPRLPMPRWGALGRLVAALAFVGFAGYSSYEALRNEPVWPSESTRELLSIGPAVRDGAVLFLGNSDYAPWLLQPAKARAAFASTIPSALIDTRSTKPFEIGGALDFDSVDAATLNEFRWVITSNTTYASQPPAGLRLVRRLPMYELWERVAPIRNRWTLEPPGAPGAVLDCHTPGGRQLSRRPGVAAVMTPPVVVPMTPIAPGGRERVTMMVPRGRWQLSLQYISGVNLEVDAGAASWRMPAYLDRPGPVFAIGSIVSAGRPIAVTVRADRPSSITGPSLGAATTALIATHLPDTRALVPLRRSCGRYVDWFRL